MPKQRTGLLSLISLIFLAIMTTIRVLLLVFTPQGSGLTFGLILKAMGIGFVFDLATLSYALLPLAIYLLIAPRRLTRHNSHTWIVRIFFTMYLAVLIFDGCAEYIFFDEFGTRFNFIAVDYLIYTQEVVGNIRESYPLGYILSAIAAAALIASAFLQKRLDRAASITFRGSYHLSGALLLIPSLATLFFINLSMATISTNNYVNEVAGNGIYSLFAAFRHNELSFSRFYVTRPDDQVMARLRSLISEQNSQPLKTDTGRVTRHITATGPEKRLNLIVVIEESLSSEYVGIFGNKQKLTPNLDKLADQSLLFTNLYATGTRTVRGLEALTLSIPPLPGTSIVKRPDNGGFRSWGEILNRKGYESKYIYAGYGYFDNMNAFFSGNGYKVVDRADFAKEEITFANIWGVCDEDLFRKAIREANDSHAKGKPFFSMVMTTSNHRPYTYPEGRIDIPSKTGREGGVKYADYSIGRLIAEASKEPWFKDTIFVIVADHCASSAGKNDIPVKRYEIPMLVYAPQHVKPARFDRLTSQIDIAPTILGMLNISYDTDFLGRDVLKDNAATPRAFVSTYQKIGYLTESQMIVLGPRKYAVQHNVDRQTGALKQQPLDEQFLADALAYYQGGNTLYKNRLNRIR